jgi:putative ABC transport system substrate-binding protein
MKYARKETDARSRSCVRGRIAGRPKRRSVLIAIGAGAIVAPLSVFAQRSSKSAVVGFIYFGSRHSAIEAGRYPAFVQGMRELGYVEGKNLVIEARFADGKPERTPPLAAELMKLNPDVIVATGSATYRALQLVTGTIPIVLTVGVDPVAGGYAASMSKPGRNFTGLTDTAADLNPKLLELAMTVIPKLARVGVLTHPGNVSHPPQLAKLMLTAQKVGVQIVLAEAESVSSIGAAFAMFERERVRAAIVFNETFFSQETRQIGDHAAKHRIAAFSGATRSAESGYLMSYGADLVDNFRRAASYVDKILKGAKPGDLPFEQPTRYYLTVNLRTAKALRLTIPQSLIVSADKVIE